MNGFRYILVFFLSLIVCSVSAREKRSLAIGISRYEDPSWSEINAGEDLYYVESLLNEYGFEDITFLKNELATKIRIVREFERLIDRSGRGDIVYIHFSGHGQLVKDLDGDESDGYDESWIPYDAYRKCCQNDDGRKHLVDDEVNVFLSRLRRKVGDRGQILVVVDACHSGGSSRGGDYGDPAIVSRGVSDVFVPEIKVGEGCLKSEDWILLSACEDYQINFEIKKPKAGKLTYCLYKLRKRLSRMSDEELMEKLTEMMDSPEMLSPLPQNPRLGDGKGRYDVKDVFVR